VSRIERVTFSCFITLIDKTFQECFLFPFGMYLIESCPSLSSRLSFNGHLYCESIYLLVHIDMMLIFDTNRTREIECPSIDTFSSCLCSRSESTGTVPSHSPTSRDDVKPSTKLKKSKQFKTEQASSGKKQRPIGSCRCDVFVCMVTTLLFF
jgi:hypothetical protein